MTRLLAIAIFALALPSLSVAQQQSARDFVPVDQFELPSQPGEGFRAAAIEWGLEGHAQKTIYSFGQPISDDLLFLRSPRIDRELELVRQQRDKIKELFEQITSVTQLRGHQIANLPHDDREVLVAQLRELHETIAAELNGVLLAHQRRRLDQLKRRYQTVVLGLPAALARDGPLGELALSDEQQESLRLRLVELRAEIRGEVVEELKQNLEELADVLTPAQGERLSFLIAELWNDLFPAVELIIYQTDSNRMRELEFENWVAEVRRASSYPIDLAGILQPHPSLRPGAANNLEMEILSGHLGEMDVMDFQHGDFLTERFASEELSDLADQWQRLREMVIAEQIDVATYQRENLKLNNQIYATRWQALLAALLPHQREVAERGRLRAIIRQRGLHASLVAGTVSEELEISSTQRREIRQQTANLHDRLLELTPALEKRIWDEVARQLEPRQRAQMRELLGPEPAYWTGAPELLLMPTARPWYVNDE